jgi:hypothetical protein
MTPDRIKYYGEELLRKTYNEKCEIDSAWQKVDSFKLRSIYLPYFTNSFEIVATRNELMFDSYLNNINLYFHPQMLIYMAIYDKQVIYHTNIYMIVNRNPGSPFNEWVRLL